MRLSHLLLNTPPPPDPPAWGGNAHDASAAALPVGNGVAKSCLRASAPKVVRVGQAHEARHTSSFSASAFLSIAPTAQTTQTAPSAMPASHEDQSSKMAADADASGANAPLEDKRKQFEQEMAKAAAGPAAGFTGSGGSLAECKKQVFGDVHEGKMRNQEFYRGVHPDTAKQACATYAQNFLPLLPSAVSREKKVKGEIVKVLGVRYRGSSLVVEH